MELKPQHQDTILDRFLRVSRIVKYYNKSILPHLENMRTWEQKEYKDVNDDNLNELSEIKDVLIQNESIFNEILCEYSLTVITFLAKYSPN